MPVTIAEQLSIINQIIDDLISCHEEPDGVIREPSAIHELSCLKSTKVLLESIVAVETGAAIMETLNPAGSDLLITTTRFTPET